PRRIDAMGAQPVPPDGEEEVMRDLRQQARTTASIEPGEQERLLEKSALGDRASLDRLVAANLGMVIRLAEGSQDKGLSVPDLVQEGSLGLIEAARTFAAGTETDFASFAERRVGEQMDAVIGESRNDPHSSARQARRPRRTDG